jgi:hypothetical protein
LDIIGVSIHFSFYNYPFLRTSTRQVGAKSPRRPQDELKRFVRFWSSKSGDNQTSLDEYISRMKDSRTLGEQCTVRRSNDETMKNVEAIKDDPHDKMSLKNGVVPIPKNHHQSSSLSRE